MPREGKPPPPQTHSFVPELALTTVESGHGHEVGLKALLVAVVGVINRGFFMELSGRHSC